MVSFFADEKNLVVALQVFFEEDHGSFSQEVVDSLKKQFFVHIRKFTGYVMVGAGLAFSLVYDEFEKFAFKLVVSCFVSG